MLVFTAARQTGSNTCLHQFSILAQASRGIKHNTIISKHHLENHNCIVQSEDCMGGLDNVSSNDSSVKIVFA